MAETVAFTLNDHAVEVATDPGLPLLTALREVLGMKATRHGCGTEGCGACTVIVDGTARFSCTLAIGDVAGRKVRTAEGLSGPDGDRSCDHPLLTAFLDHQAGQCGYCLPGILMRARALLDRGERVDRARVAAELDANLCRCGAHGRILDAVLDAARRMDRAT